MLGEWDLRSLYMLQQKSAVSSPQLFFLSSSKTPLCVTSCTWGCPRGARDSVHFFFFIIYSFCSSDHIISINVSLNLLGLFSAHFYQLQAPYMNIFFQLSYLSIPEFLFGSFL